MLIFQQEKGATNEEIEDALVKWAVCKYLPFNFFDDEETRNLFTLINPNITIPKKDAMRDKILTKFQEMQQNIKKYLSTITSKFSFTVDGWTSIINKSFYGITIHFIDEEFHLQSLVLDFVPSHGKHTGKAIADLFFKTVRFYGIENKIQGITVDNASANNSFLSELELILNEQNLEFNSCTQHFKCFSHVLNLGVQDALKVLKFEPNTSNSDLSGSDSDYTDEEEHENLTMTSISKLRYIFKKIKKSEQLDLKLQSACHSTNCKYLKPMLDVPTRWHSTSDMLERALSMKSALITLCANNTLLKYNISKDEWLLLNLLSKFLKQVKSVSLILGGYKYVTLPTVVVAFNILLDKIHTLIARCGNETEADKIFQSALHAAKAKLLKHYHKTNWIYCAVLILDPRHKTETFSMTTWGREMMDYSILTFKEIFRTKYFIMPDDLNILSDSSDKSSSDDVININILYEKTVNTSNNDTKELDEYLATKRSDKAEDILKFWNKHQDIYPNLTKMARDFLSTAATSVPSERLFSQVGLVLRKHRNRLNEDSAKSILCLISWLTANFLTG